MKTLYPKQEESKQFFLAAQARGKNTLDTSSVGTGKTIVAAHLAIEWGGPVAVICPKAVIPSWERELAEHGIKPEFVLNYEKLRGGRTKWMTKKGKKLMTWHLTPGTLVFMDEIHNCLPEGTEIATPYGSTPIEYLEPGDMVLTPIGPRPVLHKWDSGEKRTLQFFTEHGTLTTSYEHEIFTEEKGWTKASESTERDTLFLQPVRSASGGQQVGEMSSVFLREQKDERGKRVRGVWERRSEDTEQFLSSKGADYVQCDMQADASVVRREERKGVKRSVETPKRKPRFSKAMGRDENRQPNDRPGGKKEVSPEGPQDKPRERNLSEEFGWGKWDGTDSSTKGTTVQFAEWVGSGICSVGEQNLYPLADYDSGLGAAIKKMGSRIRRGISQLTKSKKERCEEREATQKAWMENSSYEERRSLDLPRSRVLRISDVGVKRCWDIEVADAHCFFADGFLVHNCKSPFTQNAQMLISLMQQGYRIHGMSATAAEDPTEMRGLGYMLGLHNLNKDTSWFTWMKQNGCVKNDWNQWVCVRKKTLPLLKQQMYSDNVKKLTVGDFPDSFKHNRVFVKPIQFSSYRDIIKIYEDLGITPEIIDQLLENHTVEDSEHVLVNLLRARQLAEALKAPDLAEMAEELRLEGNSVVLFVNFSDTVDALCARLSCPKIDGRQNAAERQRAIDSFQADETELLVVNTAAGGTGISLHDINGDRPRVSLISPTFSAKHYLQCLGRIHRNGAKSDAVQQIVVAADSIEEHVVRSINKKIETMEMLHGN